MRLYHGTTNVFDTFDYSRIGQNGTQYGIGFYFTKDINTARMYAENENGYVYTIDLDVKKPLSCDKISLSMAQVKRLLSAVHRENDILNDIEDVAYYGLEKVLNDATSLFIDNNNNDVDIICDIVHTCRAPEIVLPLLYAQTGYDSILPVINVDGVDTTDIVISLINDIIHIEKVEKEKELECV